MSVPPREQRYGASFLGASAPHLAAIGTSGAGPGSCSPPSASPQPAPEIRPLYITEEMLEMIEGWASTAIAHGKFEALGVLSQCMEYRTRL